MDIMDNLGYIWMFIDTQKDLCVDGYVSMYMSIQKHIQVDNTWLYELISSGYYKWISRAINGYLLGLPGNLSEIGNMFQCPYGYPNISWIPLWISPT